MRQHPRRLLLGGLLAASLVGAYLPNPSFRQYWIPALPPLFLCLGLAFGRWPRLLSPRMKALWAVLAVAGLATADAIRDADNTWVHPELARSEGLPKWGARWLLVGGHPKPTHGVPVSDDSLARAVKSLEAHEEYLAAIPGHPAPSEFIPQMLAGAG